MRYFSVFSGVGGFELGMPNDSECVGHSEIDKYASAVLRYRFPTAKNYGDITKIDWVTVPDFNLLVGGSPCQDLSVAGKRNGLQGTRSGLYMEFIRCLQEKRPHYFIWENVRGAVFNNGGRDFSTILNSFSEAGYSLSWQILNAKDFGVPQNRERVFVIGTRGTGGGEVFFERIESETATPSVHRWPLKFAKRNQRKISGDYAYTVDSMGSGGVRIGDRLRRFTPKECERLMSWPDDWTKYGDFDGVVKEISDFQRYKMCGNGVVSAVVKEVVNSL